MQRPRSQNDATKLKGTNALFQFNLADPDAKVRGPRGSSAMRRWASYSGRATALAVRRGGQDASTSTAVRVEFSQPELIDFFNQLETIQQQLDAVQR